MVIKGRVISSVRVNPTFKNPEEVPTYWSKVQTTLGDCLVHLMFPTSERLVRGSTYEVDTDVKK